MSLSDILIFDESNLEDNMRYVFNLFNEKFINKTNRPRYNGNFIYFETNRALHGRTLPYPEKLMHIISNDIRDELDVLPCTNDPASLICNTQCSIRLANIDFHMIDRQECYFRMSRIHWIPEIINLANLNYSFVKTWEEEKNLKQRGKNKKVTKTFIRYQNGLIDYLIILRNREKEGQLSNYIFETAFPVFFKRAKKQYDKSYNKSLSPLEK